MPIRDMEPTPLVHLSADFVRAKEYLEAIVTSTSDAICTTDTRGHIIYFSPGAERMLGVCAQEAMGQPAHDFYADGMTEAKAIMAVLRKQGCVANREMALKTKDGRRIHVSMSASLLKDRNGRVIGTLGISKDITDRIELEQRLRELSITDNLTGLHNQRHFEERIGQEVSRSRRQRYKLSIVVIDLDGFKALNDLKGHLEGDRVLKVFAGMLMDKVRKGVDSAYRYGGDEFVILLPGLAAAKARRVAERIVAAARANPALEGLDFSFGVATLENDQRVEDFINEADTRMFRMKAAKKRASRPAAPAPPAISAVIASGRPLALIWKRASSHENASLRPAGLV
ncbi:MAG: sensor domain-containing diguanylate cyclase [Elusimicrobiota bacterium]|jgi:diguanylate cyclase (GGDEF)-like protein/PAS domain S-box-containing protein